MLDRDLAVLYGVETRALNQAVKRNRGRFPPDFMLELARDEIRNIAQSVICSAIQQLTSERPPAIGFQYVGTEDAGTDNGKRAKERRARYRTKPRKHGAKR
jgi:hypothetical protein